MDILDALPDGVGDYFATPDAPHVRVAPFGVHPFSVTRIRRFLDGSIPRQVDLPSCDCYFVMQYMAAASHSDINPDGSLQAARLYPAGTLCLVDLAQGASIYLHSSLDAIALVVPKPLLKKVASLPNAPGAHLLCSERGVADATMGSLAVSLSAHLATQHAEESKSLKHLAIAICAHLLQMYGDCIVERSQIIPSLSPEQVEKAKTFIRSRLREQITSAHLAELFKITAVEFEEGLLKSTGYDRAELVNRTRLENAKRLLRSKGYTLLAIAEGCGFESENAFIEAFSRCTGMRPENWLKSVLH